MRNLKQLPSHQPTGDVDTTFNISALAESQIMISLLKPPKQVPGKNIVRIEESVPITTSEDEDSSPKETIRYCSNKSIDLKTTQESSVFQMSLPPRITRKMKPARTPELEKPDNLFAPGPKMEHKPIVSTFKCVENYPRRLYKLHMDTVYQPTNDQNDLFLQPLAPFRACDPIISSVESLENTELDRMRHQESFINYLNSSQAREVDYINFKDKAPKPLQFNSPRVNNRELPKPPQFFLKSPIAFKESQCIMNNPEQKTKNLELNLMTIMAQSNVTCLYASPRELTPSESKTRLQKHSESSHLFPEDSVTSSRLAEQFISKQLKEQKLRESGLKEGSLPLSTRASSSLPRTFPEFKPEELRKNSEFYLNYLKNNSSFASPKSKFSQSYNINQSLSNYQLNSPTQANTTPSIYF